MTEKLDEQVDKMQRPEFIEVSPNLPIISTFNENLPLALTISWQWVLAKITEALIAADSREVIKLLFCDLDYIQLNNNAMRDIQNIVRQPIDENALRGIQAKINLFKELMSEYLKNPQNNKSRLEHVINESSFVLEKIKTLEIIGLGAFMIASGFRLALLQEKAKSDPTEWSNVKDKAIEYSKYAASVNPQLFGLSVGRIDKECKCTRWESGAEGERTEYECSYFDGKDLHIFRELSPNAATACNKHRLQMFNYVVDNANEIAAQPVREAIKKWRELAASI